MLYTRRKVYCTVDNILNTITAYREERNWSLYDLHWWCQRQKLQIQEDAKIGGSTMVAGHLQEKNDFYYIVLSYKSKGKSAGIIAGLLETEK